MSVPALPRRDAGDLHVEVRKRHESGRAGGGARFQLDAAFTASPGVTMIVGPSGAGKTTILRCIAGLADPEEGRIAVGGTRGIGGIGGHLLFDSRQGIRVEPARRRVAFVFQDLALFPHLSVEENVTYGLRRLDAAERRRRMREILESFEIAHLGRRSIREISGGEQQRVALARSLVTEPAVLLLDEPLSSLDPRTKLRIVEDLQRWNRTRGIPILYVTHDHGEVLAMGDRVIALEAGRIVAEGLPLDIAPASLPGTLAAPAGFENLFDATVLELREAEGTLLCQLAGTSVRLAAPLARVGDLRIGAEVRLGVRAGEILVSATPPALLGECAVIPGRIRSLEPRGAGMGMEARIAGAAELRVRFGPQGAESRPLAVENEVWMMIPPQACRLVQPLLLDTLRRLFVFVCHGNTVRSPMAQAICNAEIAGRFGVPLAALDRLGIQAMSAGLAARPGEPLDVETGAALTHFGVPVPPHRSRNLTARLAERAEAVFCMTEEQRREVAARFPATRPKSYRLHPDADLGDPHGKPLDVFLACASQLQALVRQRLNGLGILGME
jgi:molybdate transport system ATP-binding protein